MKLYSKDGQLRAVLTTGQFEQLEKYGSWGQHPLGRSYRTFNLSKMAEGYFVTFSMRARYDEYCKLVIQQSDYITQDETNEV